MDSTQQPTQPFGAPQFPPPPPESGSAQNYPVPLADMSTHQGQTVWPGDEETVDLPPPPKPPRPTQAPTQPGPGPSPLASDEAAAPALPPRPPTGHTSSVTKESQFGTVPPAAVPTQSFFPLPPRRQGLDLGGDDDPSNPIHYIRDPHKLIAYLVPFPKPCLRDGTQGTVPSRFLIYTPPPPPLNKPADGEKEGKLHKVQRKWQEEVRSAKMSDAKTMSWQGVKSKATRGISKAMSYTTTSNLDFLGRVSNHESGAAETDPHAHDGVVEGETTKKTVGVDEMVLIYPPTLGLDQGQLREEFVNTMLRTKTKAQRDAIISTGLMPVAYGIDILATLVWPFGGLGEIDTVWAYANIRGAKTARSVTKRLSSSSSSSDNQEQDKLRLNFTPSRRIEVLRRYLAAECNKVDSKLFPEYIAAPTQSDVLEAVGWSPYSRDKNWEDEQWEITEVKDDLRLVMHKAAKEWRKWCIAFEKDPEKAMKK